MAYKEYEVARLATHDRTVERIKDQFAGPVNLRIACSRLRCAGFFARVLWQLVLLVLCALKRGKKLRGTLLIPGICPLVGWSAN